MKTEQPNADKWNAVDSNLTEGTTQEMTPDERLRFEEDTVHGADADTTAPDDADRLTKSGRLSISEVRGIEAKDQ